MAGPLEGIRVVELGVWVAGPGAGGLLADWGAEVVKLEPLSGDPARQFQRMLGADLPFNPPFELDNRGKRSVAVDLAAPEGQEIAAALIARADVFITNVRLAGLERLGLDHRTLLARHPQLVYGAITGYGMDGPERDRAAYDIAAFWARSGLVGLLTPPGGTPPFQRGGMGDHSVAMSLAGGVSAALVARARTGRGQLVSASLLRQGIYTVGFDLNTALRLGVPLGVATRDLMGNPVINSYQDSEGRWFWLVGLEGDRHWPDLARAVGHPEWIEDQRFATGRARRKNCQELIAELDAIFATRTRAEWGEELDAHDMWWAPVQTTDEVLADAQAWAAGAFVEVSDGRDGSTATMVASPVDFDGSAVSPAGMPPELGEHTSEVLRQLGYTEARIDALRTSGVVA
jgi:crotonobetainyl-CoA:carnitine CoA-transferase CaiB-like acyl-CoA transferase